MKVKNMSAKLKKYLRELQAAKCPEEVFGDINNLEDLRKKYKEWAKNTHSDLCATSEKDLADEAFKLLGEFFEQAKTKLKEGTYGNKNTVANEVIIRSKHGEYKLKEFLYSGDICDLFKANNGKKDVLLKIPRNSANNDLVKNEANKLKWFWYESPSRELKVMQHIARPLNFFEIKDGASNKQINIFELNEGFYTLEDVIKEYPEGLDPRDVAWMFNRLMGALLAAHQSNLIHGAVLPCHFLIDPKTHNGVLIDWSYSVKVGEKLKAICPKYRDFYPKEVFEKIGIDCGLDIYMAAKCILNLLQGKDKKDLTKTVPSVIIQLLKACLLSKTNRINDVWELYNDFSKILDGLYGKRKFRHFEMPRT